MQAIQIFFLSIAAAILYGIVHDHITVRICLEYFTVAHPPIFGGTQDPNLLAFGWGIIATWWVGAILGVPLALTARVGRLPKRSAKSLILPIGVLLLCMGTCAALAGAGGYWLGADSARRGQIAFSVDSFGISLDLQARFLADAFAHLASYAAGFLGGLVLIAWVLFRRWRAHVSLRLAALRTPEREASV